MDRIDYTLTKEAYLEYNLYYMKRSASIKRMVLFVQYGLPLLLILFLAVLYFFSLISMANASAISAVAYGVCVFLYPGIFTRSMKRRLRKMIDEGAGREFIGEHTLTWHDDYLQDTFSGNVFQVPYHHVEKIIENAGSLYLFIGPMLAFVLPLSVFRDGEQKTAFLALLADRGARSKTA